MKCICNRPCQTRIDGGKIKTFSRNEVWDFEECPTHFTSIESKDIEYNLDELKEDAIIELNIPREKLIKYAQEHFDANISKYKKPTSLARAFVDTRYRFIDKQQLKDMR